MLSCRAMSIRQGRTFSYEEALELFPVVRDRTAAAVEELEGLGLDEAPDEDDPAGQELRREVVARWASEIESLGCEVKGLWLVDWDSGDGYYCWRFPEPTVGHFHGYDEGFAGRLPLA